MPPQIALLLCILFILYLFIMDYRRKSNVSHALWIPLIWMMIIGSRLVSHWLNPTVVSSSQEAYQEGNPIDRTVFSILILIGLFILIRRKIYWSQVLKSNAWLILLILYSLISILWSDFPFVSFKRWIKELGTPIMVLVILTDTDPVEAVKTIIKRCAYVLIPLSIVFIKYYIDLGRSFSPWGDSGFTGVTTGKNMLGNLCLVCGFFFFWNLISMWRSKKVFIFKKEILFSIVFLVMILWLFIKINSATSMVSFIFSICVLIGLGISIFRKNVKYIGLYFAVILFSFLLVISLQFDSMLSLAVGFTGHEETFWGRVALWKGLLNMSTNPLLGSGFESFWLGDRLAEIWENYWWHPNQAHNGYIEIYLNLGLIGLFLLIGVIVSGYKKICKVLLINFDYGRFQMAFLIIATIYNITEAAFKGLGLVWFIFLTIAVECPRPVTLSGLLKTPEFGGDEKIDDR